MRFYLSVKRTCDLGDSCTLQSLSPEVARADAASREAFEAGLLEVARTVVDGPASPAAPRDEGAAFAALSSLVGAVTLARAVSSPALSEQVPSAAERLLLDAKVGKAHAGGR